MPSQIATGDCEILEFSINKIDGANTMPIFGQCQSLSFWENIDSAVIIGDMCIVDGLSIRQTFPIDGSEFINLNFRTYGETLAYSLKLFVYAITDVRINSENTTQTYVLKLCSEEFLKSSSMIMSQPYETTIDKVITDIVTNPQLLNSQKPISTVTTKGVQKLVIPTSNPLDAISMVTKRAVSVDKFSSSFVFFENRDGFNFKTIEDLIVEGTANTNLKTYYKHTAQRAEFQSEWGHWSIIDYVASQQFNVIDQLKTGAMDGQLVTFNMQNKRISTTGYQADPDFSKFVSIDGSSGSGNTLVIGPAGTATATASGLNIRSIPQATYNKYGQRPSTNYMHIMDTVANKKDTSVSAAQIVLGSGNNTFIENQVSFGDNSGNVGPITPYAGARLLSQVGGASAVSSSGTNPNPSVLVNIFRFGYGGNDINWYIHAFSDPGYATDLATMGAYDVGRLVQTAQGLAWDDVGVLYAATPTSSGGQSG